MPYLACSYLLCWALYSGGLAVVGSLAASSEEAEGVIVKLVTMWRSKSFLVWTSIGLFIFSYPITITGALHEIFVVPRTLLAISAP